MENPSRLEENWEALLAEKMAVDDIRRTISTSQQPQMHEWLRKVDVEKNEVDRLAKEIIEVKNGSNRWFARLRLNTEVIKYLKTLKMLREQGNASSESAQTYLNELERDNPQKFSHDDLRNLTSDFSNNNKIDSDEFGEVYKGVFHGRNVSIKVLANKGFAEELFKAEVCTMWKTSHRNIVKLYGYCFDTEMKTLVYDYLENGSLDKYIYDNPSIKLEWDKLYHIATETAKGLAYLHDGCKERIIHHDVKAGTVFLDSNFCPKIASFGLAKLTSRDRSHVTLTRTRGTPGYAAPEMWIPSSPITDKSDVYSFGMMLFEVLGRRRNADEKSWLPRTVWEKFDRDQLDQLLSDCHIKEKEKESAKILVRVALWCTQHTAKVRPPMSTVVKMLEKEISVTEPPNPSIPSAEVNPTWSVSA